MLRKIPRKTFFKQLTVYPGLYDPEALNSLPSPLLSISAAFSSNFYISFTSRACACMISSNYKAARLQLLFLNQSTHSCLELVPLHFLLKEKWFSSSCEHIQQLKTFRLTFCCNSLNSGEVIFSGCTKVKLSKEAPWSNTRTIYKTIKSLYVHRQPWITL